jgi:hypothetical protein
MTRKYNTQSTSTIINTKKRRDFTYGSLMKFYASHMPLINSDEKRTRLVYHNQERREANIVIKINNECGSWIGIGCMTYYYSKIK